jgi:hypothetical protein
LPRLSLTLAWSSIINIRYQDLYIFSAGYRQTTFFPNGHIFTKDFDCPALGHGLTCINDQVPKGLDDLPLSISTGQMSAGREISLFTFEPLSMNDALSMITFEIEGRNFQDQGLTDVPQVLFLRVKFMIRCKIREKDNSAPFCLPWDYLTLTSILNLCQKC